MWLHGLEPETDYRYRVEVDGEEWAAGELWDWVPSERGGYDLRLPGGATTCGSVLGRTPTAQRRFASWPWGTTGSGCGPTRSPAAASSASPTCSNGSLLTTTSASSCRSATTSTRVSRDAWTRRVGERTTIGTPASSSPTVSRSRVPIFPAIGNHDSADSEGSDDRAQMEDNFHIHERFHHGLETASVMPGLFYRLHGAGLELACLDTSLDSEQQEIHRYFQAPKHQEWLRSTFGRRADRWLIPYAHHPVYTAGPNHENDEEMRAALEPFFDAADVRLVLAGHEHNFQVSEVGGRTYISGAAGQLDEKVPEGFAAAHTTAWGAQAHLLLVEIDGPEATLTPIAGLLDDGRLHVMTALTPAMSSSSRP